MKYLLSILSLCLLLPKNTKGCINEYRTLMDGSVILTEASSASPRGKYSLEDKDMLMKKLYEAENRYKSSKNIHDYSDYATMLIYCGEYEKAKDIFLKIEKQEANMYITAANLGTIYELLGNVDSALIWLKKAVKINPNAHNGSEWIHLKILEAKKLSNGDNNVLSKIDILHLELDEGLMPNPLNMTRAHSNMVEVEVQLYLQLTERMTFIKPKDPVVGRLLFDLGNVCAITKDLKSAIEIYEKAKEYGFSSDLLEKREKHFKSLQSKSELKNNTEIWAKRNPTKSLFLILCVAGAIFFGLIYFLTRNSNKE